MATFTFSVTGLTARSKTISSAHSARLLAAYRKLYGQIIDTSVVPQTIPPTMRDMTDQETFDKFCDGIIAGMIANTHSVEEQAAVATTKAGITDIVMS